MRERLSDGEPSGGGLEVVAEERERDLVAGARIVAERGGGRRRAARGGGRGGRAHARPGRRSARRGPGARARDRARSSPRARRGSRRAGRAGSRARGRPSARSRSSRWSAADEHAVAVAASAGRRRAPARRRPPSRRRRSPGSSSSGIGLEADERPVQRPLLDQLVGHVARERRDGGTSRRGRRPFVVRPRRARTARSRAGPAAPARRSARRRRRAAPTWSGWKCVTTIRATAPGSAVELGRPALPRVGEPEARVDDRPAVVAGQEVRVHVPRAGSAAAA